VPNATASSTVLQCSIVVYMSAI